MEGLTGTGESVNPDYSLAYARLLLPERKSWVPSNGHDSRTDARSALYPHEKIELAKRYEVVEEGTELRAASRSHTRWKCFKLGQ